jgi:hypothetical protein
LINNKRLTTSKDVLSNIGEFDIANTFKRCFSKAYRLSFKELMPGFNWHIKIAAMRLAFARFTNSALARQVPAALMLLPSHQHTARLSCG